MNSLISVPLGSLDSKESVVSTRQGSDIVRLTKIGHCEVIHGSKAVSSLNWVICTTMDLFLIASKH